MARPTLNFISYNSTGLDSCKVDWIKELSKTCEIDLIQLQEHFKATKSIDRFFKKNFEDFDSYNIPAYREEYQDSGRAKGGLAQLVLKNSSMKKERIKTKSWRLQAQLLHFSDFRILWCNCYMPTDPQTLIYDEVELRPILEELEELLDNNTFDDCIIGGDLNFDEKRVSGFASCLKNFMERIGLISVWEKFPIDYTHVHTDMKSFSTIDHFFVSPQLLELVEDAGVIHLGDNPSRHSPIMIKVNVANLQSDHPREAQAARVRKPAWYKATTEDKNEYTALLEQKLVAIVPPDTLGCCDVNCQDAVHSQERDSHILNVMCSIMEASHECIPLTPRSTQPGKGRRENLPGWEENVNPARKDALFWHAVWISAGRPVHGGLHQVMCWTRNKYHYAVRKAKREAAKIKSTKLLEAAVEGNISLMKEMKATLGRKDQGQSVPDTLDGKVTQESILSRFRECYETLYNSAGTEQAMANIKLKLNNLIQSTSYDSHREVEKVTGNLVKAACSRMLPGKTDVTEVYSSDVFIHAPDILFDHLAAIFRSYLVHGTVTLQILSCAFLPLFKGGLKNPAVSDSYRAIAGASQLLKLFEYVIILCWGDDLQSDSLQFGFKSGTSTTQCSWVVNEVATYFMRRGTAVNACLLDCSKAFDKCLFDKLFEKLLAKGLPAVVIRVLVHVYEEQQGWVKLGGQRSSSFRITNGTRQGSVLSPMLFSVYLDDLLRKLRELELGCHIGGWWYGALGYADDLILLAPNRETLQKMLVVCERYGDEHNLVFSTDPVPGLSKTKCIYFSGRNSNTKYPDPVRLDGKPLPWVDHAVHLGHVLHQSVSMSQDCHRARARFISKSLEIREHFSFAEPHQVLNIIQIMCCDAYGSMLWDLASDSAEQFFKCWNTAVKLTNNLPRSTFTYLVEGFLAKNQPSLRTQVLSRYPGFYRKLKSSPSKEVRMLVNMVAEDPRSITCKNLKYLRKKTGLEEPEKYSSFTVKAALPVQEVPDKEMWRLGLLTNLMELKQRKYMEVKDYQSITSMISSLCNT